MYRVQLDLGRETSGECNTFYGECRQFNFKAKGFCGFF